MTARVSVSIPRVVTFKSIPYFYKLSYSGRKPFDIRLYDPLDPRFQLLDSDWHGCFISFVNTQTGESFKRLITGYHVLYHGFVDWVLIEFMSNDFEGLTYYGKPI